MSEDNSVNRKSGSVRTLNSLEKESSNFLRVGYKEKDDLLVLNSLKKKKQHQNSKVTGQSFHPSETEGSRSRRNTPLIVGSQ